MRLGVWKIGGYGGYNFVKNVDHFFFRKIYPLTTGYGGIFSEQQSNCGRGQFENIFVDFNEQHGFKIWNHMLSKWIVGFKREELWITKDNRIFMFNNRYLSSISIKTSIKNFSLYWKFLWQLIRMFSCMFKSSSKRIISKYGKSKNYFNCWRRNTCQLTKSEFNLFKKKRSIFFNCMNIYRIIIKREKYIYMQTKFRFKYE